MPPHPVQTHERADLWENIDNLWLQTMIYSCSCSCVVELLCKIAFRCQDIEKSFIAYPWHIYVRIRIYAAAIYPLKLYSTLPRIFPIYVRIRICVLKKIIQFYKLLDLSKQFFYYFWLLYFPPEYVNKTEAGTWNFEKVEILKLHSVSFNISGLQGREAKNFSNKDMKNWVILEYFL